MSERNEKDDEEDGNGHAKFKAISVVDAARLFEQIKQIQFGLDRNVASFVAALDRNSISNDNLYLMLAEVGKNLDKGSEEHQQLYDMVDAYCKERERFDKKKNKNVGDIEKKKIEIAAKVAEADGEVKKTQAQSDAEIRKMRMDLVKEILKILALLAAAAFFGIEGASKLGWV